MSLPVGPVVYSIRINGQQVKEFPLDAQLRQEWGSHDLFIIRIEVPRSVSNLTSSFFWPDNAPVQIVWGRRPDNLNTWYGYVNHHTICANSSSGSKATQITYTLAGTSKPMNADRTKTWGQSTGTYIAKTIFGTYGLRSILSSTNWILPFEIQANESDFSFLNRIADKIGYRMWVSGGTGYFINPSSMLTSAASQGVPIFYMDKRYTKVDTIRQFEMNQGSNLPGAVIATRTIFGVDPNTGNVFQAQADTDQSPTVTQTYTDWPATDYQTAKNLVQAKQQRSQFWITATAELFGNAYIYPGKLVYLTGLQLPQDNQGYWLVGSAVHILKPSGTTVGSYDKYVTQVNLLRNETQILPNLSSSTTSLPEYMPCRLLDGKWISEQATIFYDGIQQI